MKSEEAKLTAVETRLRQLIRAIVKRRTSASEPLTWKLMLEIEDEAVEALRRDPGLDEDYIRLVAAPSPAAESQAERPVGLSNVHAIHTAMWMIQEAYYFSH